MSFLREGVEQIRQIGRYHGCKPRRSGGESRRIRAIAAPVSIAVAEASGMRVRHRSIPAHVDFLQLHNSASASFCA
jgi:hypothetical protein